MRASLCLLGIWLAGATVSVAGFIPIEKFALGARVSRARLAPDGRHVAFLQEHEGLSTLVVLDLDTKQSFRLDPGAASGSAKEVPVFRWISNRRISFLTTIWDGLYFTGVSAVDCDGKNWVAFTGHDASPGDPNPLLATDIIHSFADKDQNVLMLDRGENSGADLVYPDVVKVSTLWKVARTVVKNPGNVVSWVPDHHGVVRLGITRDGLRFGAIFREDEAAPWRPLPLFEASRGRISPLGFDYTGQRLIVTATNDQRRRAVFYYDLLTGRLGDVIASDEKFDIVPEFGPSELDGTTLTGPVLSDLNESVLGIRYLTEGPRTLWLDPAYADVQGALDKFLPDTVNLIVSRSHDETRLLVLAYSDQNPGKYYLVDRAAGQLNVAPLGERIAGFPKEALVPMYPIKYPARDGETIHGYLTLPAGGRSKGLPLVVLPHGGPTVRDFWCYSPLVQLLANRGYAVLQMNYRGSPGYGVAFYDKGRHEIGRGMQDDIEDGTRWAIAQGVADPGRIAIVGASYGGYSTLFALAHNPGLYRCGISIAGVSDWTDFIKEQKGEEYKYAFLHWKAWIGDPKLDAKFLASISPVNLAAQMTVPLFIVQGKEDKTVPPKQAKKMVAALEKVGRPPQVHYFANEGHGFKHEKDRAVLYAEIEQFLAKNLAPVAGAK